MDTVEQIQKIFGDTERLCLTDPDILGKLARCIEHRGKFRIQINGFMGGVENINLQIRTGKETWVHVSKNNSEPDGKK